MATSQPAWWEALTAEQREIHYNRNRPCEHEYVYPGIETDPGVFDKTNEILRDSYSFDPYLHTPHLIPHDIRKFFLGTCECQTCVLKFGLEDGVGPRPVNETQLLAKLKARQEHVECFCNACWRKHKHNPNREGG